MVTELDLNADVLDLTQAIVDQPSESLHEAELADAVFAALSRLSHLEVLRDQNTIVARTTGTAAERVVIAGHLDTVPANQNLPSKVVDGVLWGLGTCDMKGGVAIALSLAAELTNPVREITWVFYEAEEIAAEFNGLGRIARQNPDWLAGDFAILMEPSNAVVEAGCQGTMRVEVRTSGERAHSARAWMGKNAIHLLAPALSTLAEYQPREVTIDNLTYREGLNAVGVSGGVAGNVIPDEAVLTVNYRFAPDLDEDAALAHLRDVFAGFDLTVTDSAPGALPGLDRPAAAAFVTAVGGQVGPKFGWTDVAKFTQLGIPAVNFGPGDPSFAHKADEQVPIDQLYRVRETLARWLSS